MDGVLDTLFSILPIALAVIWILRRVSRKSGKSDKSGAAGTSEAKAAPQQQRPVTSAPFPGSPEAREKTRRNTTLDNVLARVADYAEGLQEQTPIPRGEDAQYESIERHRARVPQQSPEPEVESTRQLVVGDGEGERFAVSRSRDSAGPSSLERVSKLPPLAQGVLWSVILDKPVGMKDPSEGWR